jgi:MtN3 and saliva related transmembrane protein
VAHVEIIGTIAAGFTTFSLLPQVIKGVRTREMHDVSLGTLLMLVAGLALWLVYGILRDDAILILANAAAEGLTLATLWLKWKYGWNYGRHR